MAVIVVDVVVVEVLTFHSTLRRLSCFASGSFD
jgi:hypothetical protein